MTDDILGKIFYHLCEPGPLSLRHLLFVSRRFYSATVNNGRLWTTISLDPLFARHFHRWREQGNIFVEQCLLRSGSLPLCLYIKISRRTAYHSGFLHDFLETFWEPEWRTIQRCTSMIWVKGRDTEPTLPMIVALLPKSLPSLKYISLSSFDDPIDGSQFPNCPVLERVEMLSHRRPSPPFWGTNFLHVTTLSFGMSATWDSDDMTTLLQFPVLHDLTLFIERDTGVLFAYGLERPICFKHLQILRVRGPLPLRVATKLMAPALKELHIEANPLHRTSIYELKDLFEPHCQHIYALLPMAVSSGQPAWATYLSDLVQKCTRIKSLHISKWMENECKKFISLYKDVLHYVQ